MVVDMAPRLVKKQKQQQQLQQQQQQNQTSNNVRRPNIWRFISVSRFGQRERRDSADEEEDHVRQTAATASHRFYGDESDRSDPVLVGGDVADDESDVCSQYTDARSNWDHNLTNREDAISFAFSELLQTGDDAQTWRAKDGSPSNSIRHHGTAAAAQGSSSSNNNYDRRPDSSRTVVDSSDAVINFQGLESQFDAYFARQPPPVPFHDLQRMAVDPYSAVASPAMDHQPGHRDDASAHKLPATPRKGKSIQSPPDWSTAENPWALLQDSDLDTDDRETILAENARLRAELDELKAMSSKDSSPESQHRTMTASPLRSPALRPSSRMRRTKNKKRSDVTLFETTTLRDLVLKRLFTPHVIVDGIIHDEEQPLTLDTPLTASQVQEFTRTMNDIIVSGSHLKQPIALCAVCHLPKFKGIKNTHQSSYVSEVLSQLPMVSASAFEDFDPVLGTSSCCRRFVCKTCLSAAIISGISTHWWFDLQNCASNWLKCPVPCCGRNLPLNSSDEISEAMQKLGLRDISPYIERYKRGTQLRSHLQQLDPLPGRDELRRSKALHDRLIRHHRMRPLLEASENPDDEDLEVTSLPIDTADGQGTLMIPIFKSLLRHRTPRTCLVCDDTHYELNTGNLDLWNKIIKGLDGDWTWRIMAFPTGEVLPGCHHDHDICRTCLSKHITAQIESRGYSAVDNITCPTPDCQHRFTHAEIRRLATPEAFTAYDRYTVLRSISSQPNFRWCLREGCVSGSLYDDPSTVSTSDQEADANCIECSECNFTMCYTCQSPWHADLTCAQHASQSDHTFTETRTWLAENTKPCPGEGCGVQVQKGDGCFHMTCSRCQFEFCWECLADWRGIFVPGEEGGFLRADGHREGCFFRDQSAPLPTQLVGTDLAAGLRRLEQQGEGAAGAAQ